MSETFRLWNTSVWTIFIIFFYLLMRNEVGWHFESGKWPTSLFCFSVFFFQIEKLFHKVRFLPREIPTQSRKDLFLRNPSIFTWRQQRTLSNLWIFSLFSLKMMTIKKNKKNESEKHNTPAKSIFTEIITKLSVTASTFWCWFNSKIRNSFTLTVFMT